MEPRAPFRRYTNPALHLTSLSPSMPSSRPGVGSFTFETLVAFLGALLIFPLVIKVVLGTVKGLLRLKVVRTLLLESAIVGLTTLLTKPGTLDKLFGPKGRSGDGVLKADTKS